MEKNSLLSLQNLSLCSTWQSLLFFLFGLSSFHLKEFFLSSFFHLYSSLYFSFHFSCSCFFVLKKDSLFLPILWCCFFFFLFILKFQVKWTISIPIISLHAHFYDSVEPEFCFYSTEILHFPLHYLIDVSQLSCLFFYTTELILCLYVYLSCYVIIQLSE